MKPKISIITLGVADFDKSRTFYKDGLGFPTEGNDDGIAFFKLEGTWLAIYPLDKLTEEIKTTPGKEYNNPPNFTLAHNVGSKEEVDRVLTFAASAGGIVVKEGQDVFWGGYSGYFKDPDGFLWEVAWNPFMDLT